MESILEKAGRAKEVILDIVGKFDHEKIGVVFSGDKDSTMLLHLIKEVCGGKIPFKVVKIDTTVEFPEITAFTEKMKKLWQLKLYSFSNDIASRSLVPGQDRDICCQFLKAEPLKVAVKSLGLDLLITSAKKDKNSGTYLSGWPDLQHTIINPVLHFEDDDVSDYIEEFQVPYCSLYKNGYRSLDCISCTELSEDKSETVCEDIEEIKGKLRSLGYIS